MPKQVINYDIMFYMFILLYMLLEDEYPNHLFLLQYRYIDLKYYHGLGEEEGFARQLQGLVELVFFETTFSGKATRWRSGL